MEVFHDTATVSLAIWDHTVLPATRHKWTHPDLTPAMQAGTRFTYPGGMEGWVDLIDLIAPRSGVEPATFRSQIRRSTTATRQSYEIELQQYDRIEKRLTHDFLNISIISTWLIYTAVVLIFSVEYFTCCMEWSENMFPVMKRILIRHWSLLS